MIAPKFILSSDYQYLIHTGVPSFVAIIDLNQGLKLTDYHWITPPSQVSHTTLQQIIEEALTFLRTPESGV